jgi:methionyl-tRNA synthetase
LGHLTGGLVVAPTEILFKKLEDEEITKWQAQFAGSQKERKDALDTKTPETPETPTQQNLVPPEVSFRDRIDLRVAKILEVKQHPAADKLFIELLETAPGVTSQIVSGLAPYYKPEELAGHHILLAANLKPAKLRGEMSNGMLLAASQLSPGGEKEIVEVIFADDIAVGTPVDLEGDAPRAVGSELKPQINIDTFFATPLRMKDGLLFTGDTALRAGGKGLKTLKVPNGDVG